MTRENVQNKADKQINKGTAKNLANKCEQMVQAVPPSPQIINKCINDIILLLKDKKGIFNGDQNKETQIKFDLIGFQEATNYKIFEDYVGNIKNRMKYVHHTAKQEANKLLANQNLDPEHNTEDMVTYYNKLKFKLKAVKVGNIFINKGKKGKKGKKNTDHRAYQIIFLEETNIPNLRYIVINVHFPHNADKNKLLDYFNFSFKEVYKVQDNKEAGNLENLVINSFYKNNNKNDINNYLNTKNLEYVEEYKEFKNAHVIFLGDTNDKGAASYNLYNGDFKIFQGVNDKNQKKIQLQKITPPNSCCDSNGTKGQAGATGDYILISQNMEYLPVNDPLPNPLVPVDLATNPGDANKILDDIKFDVYRSDHLPVTAFVRVKDTAAAAAGGGQKLTKINNQVISTVNKHKLTKKNVIY